MFQGHNGVDGNNKRNDSLLQIMQFRFHSGTKLKKQVRKKLPNQKILSNLQHVTHRVANLHHLGTSFNILYSE